MANNNPLRIYCKNCGAPAGFDIIRQTYSCPNCGQVSGIEEIKKDMAQWRELKKQDNKARSAGQKLEKHACPTCGAEVAIPAGKLPGPVISAAASWYARIWSGQTRCRN